MSLFIVLVERDSIVKFLSSGSGLAVWVWRRLVRWPDKVVMCSCCPVLNARLRRLIENLTNGQARNM